MPKSAADRPVTWGAWVLYLASGGAIATLAAPATRAEPVESPDVAVTPYRPTVSTPATLSAPGWLEAEAGLAAADLGAGLHRESLPFSLKLAFSPDWGIRVGGEAWVRAAFPPGASVASIGDTSLVLKRRLAVNERTAFGIELGVTAPTARAGTHSGSGGTDYTATGIYSADFSHALHADINLGVTQLGAADPSTGRRQALWAAALQEGVNDAWGLVAELSGTRQTGVRAGAQLLAGATYSPAKRVTWDFGVVRGFTATSPAWGVFVGTTFLVARVF